MGRSIRPIILRSDVFDRDEPKNKPGWTLTAEHARGSDWVYVTLWQSHDFEGGGGPVRIHKDDFHQWHTAVFDDDTPALKQIT